MIARHLRHAQVVKCIVLLMDHAKHLLPSALINTSAMILLPSVVLMVAVVLLLLVVPPLSAALLAGSCVKMDSVLRILLHVMSSQNALLI